LARYRGPVCRLCRAEGKKLFLKGVKCETPKCPLEKKNYGPGQHGQARKKLSEYALQLREKQSVRRKFSVSETQFKRYYKDAVRSKDVTGTVLLRLLELRLDNAVYASSLVASRAQGRQLLKHGHFLVNGKKVNVPSYQVKVGDIITAREKSAKILKALVEGASLPPAPSWLEVDKEACALKISSIPQREDMDTTIQESLIIEYYSR